MGYRVISTTGNEGKMREIRLVSADLGLPMLSMREADAEPEVVENGSAFGENVETKARAVWNLTGDTVLAGDSDLEIDHTGGEPGTHPTQYLGKSTPYAVRNQSIIERLKEVGNQERGARFVCNITTILPDSQVLHTEAVMGRLIAGEPTGEGGFRYDPILYLPEFGKTSAGITMDQKNEISRRGKISRAMKEALEGVLR